MNQMSQASAAVAYVRFVLDELKLSASGLAKGAGLASTTITRALNDPDHRFELSMSTLKKIAAFSGISPTPFFQAKDFADLSMVPFTQPDLYDETWGTGANPTPDDNALAGSTPVIGAAAFGVFRSPELIRVEDAPPLLAALTNAKLSETFALRVADRSVGHVLPEGHYALCVRTGSFVHGNLVAVERWTDDRRLVELSIRRLLVPEMGPPFLRMEGREPIFGEILTLPADLVSDPKVRILGAVRYGLKHVYDDTLDEEWSQRVWAKRRAEKTDRA